MAELCLGDSVPLFTVVQCYQHKTAPHTQDSPTHTGQPRKDSPTYKTASHTHRTAPHPQDSPTHTHTGQPPTHTQDTLTHKAAPQNSPRHTG